MLKASNNASNSNYKPPNDLPNVFFCYICEAKYETKSKSDACLMQHLQNATDSESEEPWTEEENDKEELAAQIVVPVEIKDDESEEPYSEDEEDERNVLDKSNFAQKHECDECGFSTHNSTILKNHKDRHKKGNNYLCSVCKYLFTRKYHLERHMLNLHSNVNTRKPQSDKNDTNHSSDSEDHKNKNSNERRFICPHCKKAFLRQDHLNNHVRYIHLKKKLKKFRCKHCDYSTYRPYDFKRHQMQMHSKNKMQDQQVHTSALGNKQVVEKKHNCEQCDYSTYRLHDFKRHKMRKHSKNKMQDQQVHTSAYSNKQVVEKKHNCEQCGYSTNKSHDLKRHKMRIHLKEKVQDQQLILSPRRDEQTYVVGNSTMHQTQYSNTRKYSCPKCEKSFKRSDSIRNHLRYIHLKEKLKKFRCEHCDYNTYLPYDFKRHQMRKHSKNKMQDQQVHTSAHSNKQVIEKKHNCEQCDYSTNYLSHFKRHQICHSGGRNHKCTYCKKYFKGKNNLKEHVRCTHLNQKLQCNKCNYITYRPYDFKRHQARHSTERKFNCAHCEKSYKYKDDLHKHMKIHMKYT